MRAIIADDEIHLAEDLRCRLEKQWPELEIVAVLHDGDAAASALSDLKPDIAFLDIRMPGKNGLDAARSAHPLCRIVFVTAYDEHAVQAFDLAAVDYLQKPVSDERLQRCVERLKRGNVVAPEVLLAKLQHALEAGTKQDRLHWLRIQVGQSVRLVAVEDVCYFQSSDKYTLVVTKEAEMLLRMCLKELIERLDSKQFWQVHRGTVVNVNQVVSAHHGMTGKVSLTLRDRVERIAVSRAYAYLFRQM